MNKINIKLMSDSALAYLKKNIENVTTKIISNDENDWVYRDFKEPIFVEKNYAIDDIELSGNPDLEDKEIDIHNSILLYEALNNLPNYILTDERFWLWLYFEKFYKVTKSMMKIKGPSTIKDHWTFEQGVRRGLMFGVLSRCFYRVALTIEEDKIDKYNLTRWIIQSPERYRNLTWRSFSSERHLVRGIIRGEKRAVDEYGYENNDFYAEIAKFISQIGSVRLLDVIDEKDVENMVYNKMKELYNK